MDDCRHDLAAGLDWLRQHVGPPRVELLAHSLGAVKCLYAAAHEPAFAAACVVALSPPRLSSSWFCSSPEGPQFQETYTLAQRRVEADQAAALLVVRLLLAFVTTAGSYVEKYGPEERTNYLRFITDVPCPVPVTPGSAEAEHNMAFRQTPEALREPAGRHGWMRATVVAGADHFYSGARSELIGRVIDWLGGPSG